jgi:hypothetical protein
MLVAFPYSDSPCAALNEAYLSLFFRYSDSDWLPVRFEQLVKVHVAADTRCEPQRINLRIPVLLSLRETAP